MPTLMKNPFQPNTPGNIWLLAVVFSLALAQSACVSSKLSNIEPEPAAPTSQLALTPEALRAEQLRRDGVAEIHAKAAKVPDNEEPPAYGLPRNRAAPLLTPQEVATKTREIEAMSDQTDAQIKNEDFQENQRKMRELRKKGSTHYQKAIKKIEKKQKPIN